MSDQIGRKIVAQVLAAIPSDGDGIGYREIESRVGMWSPSSIRKAVRGLIQEGAVLRVRTAEGTAPLFKSVEAEK